MWTQPRQLAARTNRGRRVVRRFSDDRQPFCTPGFPFLTLRFGTPCVGPVGGRHISNNAGRGKRAPGLSMARSGQRPATPRSPEPQWLTDRLSSPGLRPFLAGQESLPPPSSAALWPKTGAAPIAFGFQIAIEAVVVAARQHQGEVTWLTSAHSRNPDRNSRAKS